MNRRGNIAIALVTAGLIAAFVLASTYAACAQSIGGDSADALAAAIDALPAFVIERGVVHTGALPLSAGLIAACAVWAVWAYSLTHGAGDRAGEEHGSAQWGSIRRARRFADTKDEFNNAILTQNVGLAIDSKRAQVKKDCERNLNQAVVGGSGSGKTFYGLLPNIMQMNCNYFITDPKGQALPMARQMLADGGYKILSFNTIEFDKSLHYNPLAYARDEADILEFVACLIDNTTGDRQHVGDPFWENAERLLYVALIGYLVKHCPKADRSLSGLVTLLSLAKAKESDEGYMSPLDLLFYEVESGMRYVEAPGSGPRAADPLLRASDNSAGAYRWVRVAEPVLIDSDFCLLHYKMLKDAAGKTMKSILVSCNTRMEPFAIPQVRELVSFDEMELDRLGDADSKRAVFAVMSDTSPLYSFLFAIMMWQALNILCKRALVEFGGALPVHVRFMLDEFANIGKLPDVEKAIAVVRSRNISMTIYLQSLAQLKSKYKDDADTIVDCCDTLLFLGGKSTDTVKAISESVGKQTVGTFTWNESRGGSSSSTRNWGTVERDLIQAAEVAKLPRGEAIVLISGADPLRDKKVRHHEAPQVGADIREPRRGETRAVRLRPLSRGRPRGRGGQVEREDGAPPLRAASKTVASPGQRVNSQARGPA